MSRRYDGQRGSQPELAARLRDLLAARTAVNAPYKQQQQPWSAHRGAPIPSSAALTKSSTYQSEKTRPFEFLPPMAVHRRVVATVEAHLATKTELMVANRDRDALQQQLRSQEQAGESSTAALEEDRRQLITERERLTRQIKREKLRLLRMPETEKSLSIDHESGSPIIDEEAPSESFHTPLAVSSSNKENDLDEDYADRTRLSGLSELTLIPDESPPTHPRSPPPAPAQSRRSLPGGINLKLAFDPPPRKKGPPPLPSYARKTTFISFNQLDSGLSRDDCLAATSENPPSVAMYSSSAGTDTPVIISNDTTVCNVEDDQDEVIVGIGSPTLVSSQIAESQGWLRTIHDTLCTSRPLSSNPTDDTPSEFEKGLAEGKRLPRPSDETELLKAAARLLLADCQSSILSSPSPYAAVVRFIGKVPLGVTLPGAPPDDPPPDDDTN